MSSSDRWYRDMAARENFIKQAVVKVYNECPEQPFRYFKLGGGRPYSMLLHEALTTITNYGRANDPNWDKRSAALTQYPNRRDAEIYQGALRAMTPHQRQALLQRAIAFELEHYTRQLIEKLPATGVVRDNLTADQKCLTYGLTTEQKKRLYEQAKAYKAFIDWQSSPERAIEEIEQIRDATLDYMDKLGDSYR